MSNTLYSLLSHRWSGLLVAAVVGMVALVLLRLGRRPSRVVFRWLGVLGAVAAVVLAVGAGTAMAKVAKAMKQFPPPGKLVDVGGYRMHILAEGEARGRPTVVWITGSHEGGLPLYHLHKVIRQEGRSILFDRPGSGYSDPGPFPRRTGREADELATLLGRAGERGPFVVVGHSYGGLLAANFARRYPNQVAALVMADGTPPDVFMYLPDGGGPGIPGGIVRGSKSVAWKKLFGLGLGADPDGEVPPADTGLARLLRTIKERLVDVNDAIQATNMKPDWATPSIFEEWRDPKSVADLTVYDLELGSLPVYVVTPAGKAKPEEVRAIGVGTAETDRALHFLEQARMRYTRISSKSELIHTAPGTGHNYPYETPEFLLDVVRRAMGDSPARAPIDSTR